MEVEKFLKILKVMLKFKKIITLITKIKFKNKAKLKIIK